MYITLSDVSDVSIVSTNDGWNVNITVTKCGYYLKYPWGSDHAWTWSSALTDCGGGVYACTGPYNGTTYDYGRRNSDGGAGGATAVTGATTVNSPSTDDKCVFELTYSTGALKITRCNQVNNGNHVYFDNSVSGFTGNLYLVIGHDKPTAYSKVYALTRVTGTNLYHVDLNSDTWDDVTYYAVIGSSSDASTLNGDYQWGSSSLSTKGTGGYTAAYTGNYDLNGTNSSYKTFLITTASAGNGKDMTITYQGSGYSDVQKFNASQAAKKRDTGTSYSDVEGLWPATLKLRGSYMKNATDTARSTITSTTSEDGDGNKTYGAIRTGEITHTYESLSSSYHFEGWGTGSTPSNTDASYSYNITSATTTYAFFSKLYTLTYAVKGDYSTSTVTCYSVADFSGATTSGSSIPTGHLITIVATPAPGYEVKGWYSDASCTSAYSSGSGGVTIEDSNNTFKLASLNADTEVYPKFGPKTYTINLANMDADEAGTTSVTVTYNASTNMTSPISTPTKAHYEFGGYWTSENTGATLDNKLIDEDGNWIADVTGYTSNDGAGHPTWIHDYAISLYAKWTETPYTITMAVSPAGAGTTSPASTATGKLVTESGDITATPAAGYKFKEWQFSKTDEAYDVWCADGYSSTDATIHIKAQHNGTLTAVFEERYSLVGSLQDDSGNGGMPGWKDYTKTFTVNSSSPVDLTRTCTLQANKTYKLQVHDLATSTNLGRSGCDPVCVLEENASLVMENSNNDVFLYTGGAGEYIFKITAVDGSGHPTLTVLRPHQLHMGHVYAGIDNTSATNSGDTGGTLTATISASSVSNGDWFNYGSDIAYTATPATGYTAKWYTNDGYSSEFPEQPANSWTDYNVTHDENVYVRFTEKSTSVTLGKTGKGTITVGGSDFTWDEATTCGVTTTRALVATAATGYTFTSWSLSADPDFQLDDKSGDDDNTVTLKGKGTGTAGTLTANFSAKTYSVKLNNDHDGGDLTDGSATATYDATSLDVSSHAAFSGWNLLGYWNGPGVKVANADGSLIANVDGYTDSEGKWIKDAGETVNLYAHWSRTYTINENGGTTPGSVTVTYNSADATVTAPVWSGYTLERVYAETGCTNKLMEANGHLIDYDGYVSDSKWTKKDDATLYAKWVKVIYRTGDKTDGDTHHPAAGGSVESYSGSAIPVTIEYRMKVDEIGKWYTLCLPFDVEAVRVWDGEDGRYYDLVPYYRSGDKYYNGHYVIRTPDFKTDGVDSIAISRFGEWVDPTSSAFTPVANTPYTIQWPNLYFENRYVSFFGTSISSWPSTMTPGEAPTDNTVVNVYGNTTMVSGQVPGAYMLDNDYGVGAWLRLEEEEEEEEEGGRTIPPFECYIRASDAATPLYVAIRPGMTIVDTPTGWDAISNPAEKATKVLIDGQLYIYRDGQMYTVQGTLVK